MENGGEGVREWIHEIRVPAALVSFTYRTVQRYFAQELAPYHIGWGHFSILMALYRAEGCSQDELALSRGFDKTMVAKSIVKLEAEGLVRRVTDPEDRRVRRLYLTEKARSLRPELRRIGRQLNGVLLNGFGPEGSGQVLENLRKIALNAAEIQGRQAGLAREGSDGDH